MATSGVHPFCNLQSRARTHAVLVIGLYELLGNPTTYLIEQPLTLFVLLYFVKFWKHIIALLSAIDNKYHNSTANIQILVLKDVIGVDYGVERHFQKYFSYIVAVSFIGGGHRRKPPICH